MLSLWLCGSQQTGKFFKRWEYQTTLPASYETCMQVKKQPDMEQQTGSKLGKEFIKAVYCQPVYSTSMQSTSCEILGWMKNKLDKAQTGIKITRRNINNLRYEDDTIFMAKWRGTKEPLDEVKESEKAGLKLNIQITKIIASGPIASWQIDGKIMETVTDLIFWAPESLQMVTAAMKLRDACSLEEELGQT